MKNNYMIKVENLCKSFKGEIIIDNINLMVEKGDVFGFLGPNGSGKTTTIRLILKLIHSDKGTVKINGFDIESDFNRAIEKVGAIVETPKFHPYLSGRKNLELMANIIDSTSKDSVEEALKAVGLTNRADDKVKTYSLGMKQRLGIANALLNNPELVILDEPTNGLDPQGMKEIRDLVLELASKKGITFFISTHLLHEVEQICNKVAILHKGRIIAQGKVKDLLNVDYETLEVCMPISDKAMNIINEIDYVKACEKSAKGVVVKVEKGHSAQLNYTLNSNNIEVEYLIPHNQSLETFFIELTNGGDKNV